MATNEQAKPASAVQRQTISDRVCNTAVPGLTLSQFSTPSDLVALVYEPSLCIVAQGVKEVLLVDEAYRLDAAQSLLVSVALLSPPESLRHRRPGHTLRFASRSTRQWWASY